VVDFAAVAGALASDLEAAGGEIVRGAQVWSSRATGGGIELAHRGGTSRARFAVFCAGAWSDRLAVAAGAPAEPRIVPFRGGYLRLRPERRHLVRASLYPVPDLELPFLGAHATRTIDGEVLLGPSALMVGARDAYRPWRVNPRDLLSTATWPGTPRLLAGHWRAALSEIGRAASRGSFVRELRRLLPELAAADTMPGPSGVRAQALGRDGALIDDFVIHRTERAVHVRNAPSPAATSSLALARLIADAAEEGTS
jgi:L-2-hydroxyglutarate oxidase LhgO